MKFLAGVFVLFTYFVCWNIVYGQNEIDTFQPFHQGMPLLLPGSSTYLSDIPHDVNWLDDHEKYRSLLGTLLNYSDWSYGTNKNTQEPAPGLLFEEIPYPLKSNSIFGWFPMLSNSEWMDMPAMAWWGRGFSTGGVQILDGRDDKSIGGWLGNNGNVGGAVNYCNETFSLSGTYQHSINLNEINEDMAGVAKVKWLETDSQQLLGAFLGSVDSVNNYWCVAKLNWSLNTGDFQTLKIIPYYQSAADIESNAQVLGGIVNYDINLAGLIDSQFGIGENRTLKISNGITDDSNNGYLQNTEKIDALGMLNIDLAFRLDFSSEMPTDFSTIIGIKKTINNLDLIGGYYKSVSGYNFSDIQTVELGFNIHDLETWSSSLKYLHRDTDLGTFDGGVFQLVFNTSIPKELLIKSFELNVKQVELKNNQELWTFDTSFEIAVRIIEEMKLWFKYRNIDISRQDFYGESGLEYEIGKTISLFVFQSDLGFQSLISRDWDQTTGMHWCVGFSMKY